MIASATIDPKPFLQFFFPNGSNGASNTGGNNVSNMLRYFSPSRLLGQVALSSPLQVSGRTYPVEQENRHFDTSEDFVENLVNVVIESLEQYPEGNCLVFLPGATEIDKSPEQQRLINLLNYLIQMLRLKSLLYHYTEHFRPKSKKRCWILMMKMERNAWWYFVPTLPKPL